MELKSRTIVPKLVFFVLAQVAVIQPAATQSADELAKQFSHPIANLISVPFRYNDNSGFGDGDGSRTGLGNVTQSFAFSPKAPTRGGLVWGVGPVLQIPTATDGIAPSQWGAGITGVVLKQANGWTIGMLANHVWSLGKTDQYGDASDTFRQPFLSHTTKQATSFGINTEATYNWEAEEWSVPVNLTVGQIIKIGGKPVQLTGGVRYWADSPEGEPQDRGHALPSPACFRSRASDT